MIDSSKTTPIYPPLGTRIRAFGFDYLIMSGFIILSVIVGFVGQAFFPEFAQRIFSNPLTAQLLGFITLTLPVTLYFSLSESSSKQGSWGKQRVGVRVVQSDGSDVGLGRALLRTTLKFIPWELSHFLIWQSQFAPEEASQAISFGFALVWILILANLVFLLWSKKNQTIYGYLSGTGIINS